MERIHAMLFRYLKDKVPNFKKTRTLFTCPCCGKLTANIVPRTNIVACLSCGKRPGDVVQLVKLLEPEKASFTDDEVVMYLRDLFEVDVITDTEIIQALEYYEKLGFDLVPIAARQKIPIEKDWVNVSHKSKDEWLEWLKDGLNIGLKTGKNSGVTIVDIDSREIPEELKPLLNHTLIQKTGRGWHYIYSYEPELYTTALLLNQGTSSEIHIDISNEGHQCVMFPSKVDTTRRKLNFKEAVPTKMSPELLEYLKSKLPRKPVAISSEARIKEELTLPDLSGLDLNNINEGTRTTFLLRTGGILRKELNLAQTEYTLSFINRFFCKPPLPERELRNIINSLDKYISFDEQDLAIKILGYLRIVEEATARDVKEAFKESKERIDKALAFLVREEYIIKKRRMYCVLKKVEWEDTFVADGAELKYNIPYFNEVAKFRNGDLILIGGQTKVGKTHIALNIIKQLVEQGQKPKYINLESGNRFAKIAAQLGLKEGDFSRNKHYIDPSQMELDDNAITILDWLLPTDYAETDKLFQRFAAQLMKHGGILIVFMQLKDGGEYFAKNMVGFFPAFACRYFYDKDADGNDVPHKGYFHVDYMREPIVRQKTGKIPCEYDWESKRLNRVEEVREEKKEEDSFLQEKTND